MADITPDEKYDDDVSNRVSPVYKKHYKQFYKALQCECIILIFSVTKNSLDILQVS